MGSYFAFSGSDSDSEDMVPQVARLNIHTK
jgi:hypothetical protein